MVDDIKFASMRRLDELRRRQKLAVELENVLGNSVRGGIKECSGGLSNTGPSDFQQVIF
jgi:hypothetical protein